MTITLQAIYEQGTLRLMQPLDLPEGTPVQVIIASNDPTEQENSPAEILAQIAALPLEGNPDNFY